MLRYEIRDILPPPAVRVAMELQAEAERRKRAQILESEGQSQSKINVAEAQKREVILASEASREDQTNRATGEAEAIYRKAEATSRGITQLAQSIEASGGSQAVSLRVAEQYLDAFGEIAKKGTTMLLPASANDPASMVAQALNIYGTVTKEKSLPGGGDGGDGGVTQAANDVGGQLAGRGVSTNPSSTAPAAKKDNAGSNGVGVQRPLFSLQSQ